MEELKVVMSLDAEDFNKNLKEAGNQLNATEKQVEKNTLANSAAANALGKTFKKLAGTVAAAFTVKSIVNFAKSCVEAADQIKETESTYKFVVGDGIAYADAALEKFSNNTGILSGRVKGQFSQLIASYQGLGLSTNSAVDASEKMLEMSADMAAMWNTTSEDVLPALQNAMTGNYRSLKSYGIILNEQIVAQAAVEQGLIANEKAYNNLSEAEKALIRTDITEYMLEQQGVMGRAAAESSGLENAMANLNFAWTEFKAVIGEPILQNIVIPAIQGLQEGLSGITEQLPDMSELFQGVGEKIGEFLANLPEHLANAKEKFAEFKETASTVVGVIAAIAEVVGIGMIGAFVAANPVLAAVIGVVAALAAAVIYCAAHWDEIKAKVSEVAENVKSKVQGMVEKVSSKFNEMKASVSEKVESVKSSVSEGFSNVKASVSDAMSAAESYASSKLSTMQAAFEAHGGGIEGIVAGLSAGVQSVFSDMYAAVDSATNGGLSTVVASITSGLNGALSTAQGILDTISSAFDTAISSAATFIENGINKIKGFFDFSWELPSLKLPHFEVTGKFSLNPPAVPHFSISWAAMGGVFDNPTLFSFGNGKIGGLGEAGAEAVVPLENNTEWLDKIADRLNEKMGSNPIVIEVDGKVFGQIACDSINGLTRQTGRLNLNLT